MFLLFILFISQALSGDKLVKLYDRTIIIAKDVHASTNSPERTADPNWCRTKTFIGETDEHIEQEKLIANQHLIDEYGIDFLRDGIYNATAGWYILPGKGLVIQYANGEDHLYRVIFDSKCKKFGVNQNRIGFQWGHLMQLNPAGVFPGGRQAGKAYAARDIIGLSLVNMLDEDKKSEWTTDKCKNDWKCREVIRNYTTKPTKTPVNAQGFTEQFGSRIAVDFETNQTGFMTVHVTTSRAPNGNVTQTSRNVITWGRMMHL